MRSKVAGITVESLHWRAWDDVVADVWNVKSTPCARGEYVSPAPRLVLMLRKDGEGGIHVAANAKAVSSPRPDAGKPATYVPAGMPVWARADNVRALTHLDLHFNMSAVRERFGDGLDDEAVERPRLQFSDDRLMALAGLIAEECMTPSAAHSLYADSLINAVMVSLWQIGHSTERRPAKLSQRQLRAVTGFIEDNCTRTIRLKELADLAGLSQSYFCQIFRMSTGLPPHQWQMRARIARVKDLLGKPEVTLTAAAMAAGFSDQAHLTRTFRRIVGTTPAVWQRNSI